MSERSIRQRIGAILETAAGTVNVHTEAQRIDTEEALVSSLGEGTDAEGRNLLHGWVVFPAKTQGRRATRGWRSANYRFRLVGYRSAVDGQEELMEQEGDAVEAALLAMDAFASTNPSAFVTEEGCEWSVYPASINGLPVWELQMEVTVREFINN